MAEIEVYERYDPPVSYRIIKTRVIFTDFSEDLTSQDHKVIKVEWKKMSAEQEAAGKKAPFLNSRERAT